MPSAAPKMSLSERQRQHTKRLHKISDATVAGKLVVILNSGPELYGRALSTFYPIVCAIENAIDKRKDHPQLRSAAKVLESTRRRAAMEADLQFYLGTNWHEKVYDSPALQHYVKYVNTIEQERPVALLAFFYTNYMAFVSGGNIIRSRVRKSFSPPAGVGSAMFEFEGGGSEAKKALKSWFNDLADSLTDEEQSSLVAECGAVFTFNNEVLSTFPVEIGSALHAAARILASPVVLLLLLAVLAVLLAVWLPRVGQ